MKNAQMKDTLVEAIDPKQARIAITVSLLMFHTIKPRRTKYTLKYSKPTQISFFCNKATASLSLYQKSFTCLPNSFFINFFEIYGTQLTTGKIIFLIL